MRFAVVNRTGSKTYIANYQRHHLIPIQASHVLADPKNGGRLFKFDIDNFSENGLLLPSNEMEASRSGLPMHRGPHPRYNDLVIERVLQIMRHGYGMNSLLSQAEFFEFRIRLLQKALKKSLIKRKLNALILNKRDPFGGKHDYQDIDNMVDRLWSATKSLY